MSEHTIAGHVFVKSELFTISHYRPYIWSRFLCCENIVLDKIAVCFLNEGEISIGVNTAIQNGHAFFVKFCLKLIYYSVIGVRSSVTI